MPDPFPGNYPSLFNSNFSAFAPGPQRDHFLAMAAPRNILAYKQEDPQMFEPADYGNLYAAMPGNLFSAAWSWLARQKDCCDFMFYTDV